MPSGHYHETAFALAAPEPGSSMGPWFVRKNTISAKLRDRLIEELNINSAYTDRSKQGLRVAWARFLECSDAIKRAKKLSDAGNWPTDIPAFTEYLIVDIFIGKTTWYNSYIKIFEPINVTSDFAEMKAWLDDDHPQEEETEDIWGVLKSSYTMEELREWMSCGGTLKKKKNRRSVTPDRDARSKGKQPAHRKKKV